MRSIASNWPIAMVQRIKVGRALDFLAVACYGVMSLAANWPAWPGNISLMRQGDLDGQLWTIAWLPFALLHGHNPFYTTWMNAPVGINLAQNNMNAFLGLLLAPITLLASPVAALNTLIWLAYTASASSMYFVLTRSRWIQWRFAAFLAGALYGFSPYMIGQGDGHIALDFLPILPVFFYLTYKMYVRQERHPIRLGVTIGLLFAIQYNIFSEIAFTMVIMVAIGLVVLAVRYPGRAIPAIRRTAASTAATIATAFTLLAYPLWIAAKGPYHFIGSVHPTRPGNFSGLSADLMSTVFPTSFTRFAPSSWTHLGNSYSLGDFPEIGSYLGIPLLLLIGSAIWRYRRDRWIQFCGAMALAAFLLSLGPWLVVDNHYTAVQLPFHLVMSLPLFSELEPVRLSLYEFLFLAVLLARAADRYHADVLARRGTGARAETPTSPFWRRWAGAAAVALLTAAAVMSLVPAWPLATYPTGVPAYFTSSAVDRIPPGSITLISPYPSVAELQPMLWQAEAGMRFRIIGGYGFFRDRQGAASLFPAALEPFGVEEWLWTEATGGALPYPGVPPPPKVTRRFLGQVRRFLRLNGVGTVIWTNVGTDTASIYTVFTEVLGRPSEASPTLAVWYGVRRDLSRRAHATS